MIKPFEFLNPGKVKLLAGRVSEQKVIIDTSGPRWDWEDGGRKFHINWETFVINKNLIEILKYFIYFKLENYAAHTVFGQDVLFIRKLAEFPLGKHFPWGKEVVKEFLNASNTNESYYLIYYSLKSFYKFGLNKGIFGFDKAIINTIEELKPNARNSYESIYLRQNVITSTDEVILLRHLEKSFSDNDLVKCRDNVILHLGYELAPRPIQIHSIDEGDFNIFSATSSRFYSINLPMAKKHRAGAPEKRLRSISNGLGEKIEKLISLNKTIAVKTTSALFIDIKKGERLSSPEITDIVVSSLKEIGFKKGDSMNLLRHHLGQSLADQGAPAEVIAELLGHNSTVSARAYIGATPEISSIKTRALGKNETYLKIIKMLVTGEIIEKDSAPKDRWVKGLVGSQYIGGIGSCGLSSNTSCPKNPIYSCYTCSKFHPFIDGTHIEVKAALEKQTQYFIDTAERGIQIESNRTLIQLEMTMQAVDVVIEKCTRIPNHN